MSQHGKYSDSIKILCENKLTKKTLLPSPLEDDEAEVKEMKLMEQILSQTEFDVRGPKDQHLSPDRSDGDGGENENEEAKEGGVYQEEESVMSDEDEACDLTGKMSYMKACKRLQVVPVSRFLENMENSELVLMHRGLGPKGTKALAVPLVTNTSILRLNLRDNWMEGTGGAAIAKMLKENRHIKEVDLSENKLGDLGARAMFGMLKENRTLVSLDLSGNHFTDQSAEYLGPALLTNSTLQHLDLSYNTLGECTGQTLGDSLSENTGLTSLCLAWNCFQGRGAVMLAKGLGGNIFLRTVDLSYNNFGKDGAFTLGQALKENNFLEELNVSNNRIPPEGAIHLAMGLKVNKTIRFLNIGRNPIYSAGCYRILQAVQENPDSCMETLDFTDITVNQDFEELYTAVKEIFSALKVKHGGTIGTLRKAKPSKVLQ